MRRSIFFCGMAILFTSAVLAEKAASAQAPAPGDSTAVPHFTIVLADGTHFTWAQLKAHTPLMLVYYSPTCEHCQHFGQQLAAHLDQFKGAQIVMVTFRPLSEVADYTRICHLDQAHILIGSEGLTFLVQKHYNIEKFPFVAVYDKRGKLSAIYRDPPDLTVLHRGLFGPFDPPPGKIK